MKAIKTFIILCLLASLTACHGQNSTTQKKAEPLKDTQKSAAGKTMNLLDEQTKMYGQLFEMAGMGEQNPLGGAENYGELIEKIDLPEEQKTVLREQYKIYELSLDPTKKDSLKIKFAQMLENALERSRNDPID